MIIPRGIKLYHFHSSSSSLCRRIETQSHFLPSGASSHNSAIGIPEMSNSNPSSHKRKRPEMKPPSQVDDERAILDLIKSKKDSGIWTSHIKLETKLPVTRFNKAFKSLLTNKSIKEVPNIQNKGRKHYMAAEFEPCKELSGGDWYADGEFDRELIDTLKKVCFRFIGGQRVSTLEGVHNAVKKNRVVTFDISAQQVGEILNSMVLDDDIIEMKSTGWGNYYSIPQGTTCYRVAGGTGGGVARGPRMGEFASILCGACPRISSCTSDGAISPSTCVYYTKWLNVDF